MNDDKTRAAIKALEALDAPLEPGPGRTLDAYSRRLTLGQVLDDALHRLYKQLSTSHPQFDVVCAARAQLARLRLAQIQAAELLREKE